MKKQGYGKIINIASSVAYTGAPAFLHYTTSKGGVVSMTRALANGLGSFNINVNAVAPGLTVTEASESITTDEAKQGIRSRQSIKRITRPEHIASAVVFLSSSESDQITGHILAVNAGECLI